MKFRVQINIYDLHMIEGMEKLGSRRSQYVTKALQDFMRSKKGKETLRIMTGEKMKGPSRKRHIKNTEETGLKNRKGQKAERGVIDLDDFFS